MRSNHTQMELDGDLFSGLEEAQEPQPEERPYDKIIETRKNTTFASEQIERRNAESQTGITEFNQRMYRGLPETAVLVFAL